MRPLDRLSFRRHRRRRRHKCTGRGSAYERACRASRNVSAHHCSCPSMRTMARRWRSGSRNSPCSSKRSCAPAKLTESRIDIACNSAKTSLTVPPRAARPNSAVRDERDRLGVPLVAYLIDQRFQRRGVAVVVFRRHDHERVCTFNAIVQRERLGRINLVELKRAGLHDFGGGPAHHGVAKASRALLP